jgi:hypothetical protein
MHTSKKTMRLACSLALIVSLSVSVGADAEPDGVIPASSNNTEFVKSPQRGRRSVGGHRVPAGIEYPWLMPMFGVEMCSEIDGYLCGIGIRVGTTAYFLASVVSAGQVTSTLRAYFADAGPGVFDLGAPDRIDISQPNDGDSSYWRPEFKQMIGHNIGLFQIYVRKAGFFLMAEGGYPNKVSAPLQTKESEFKKDCFLLSYGHRKDGDRGIDAPMRYKNYVPVKRIKCNDYLCDMETVIDIVGGGNPGGYICGAYSELGAPIVCGYGPEETVDYIVSEVETTSGSNCSNDFKALEVSGYGQKIIDQVAKWEKYDKNLNKHRPRGFGR